MATLTKARKAELKASALESLKEYDIQAGATIYTDTVYVGNVGTAYVRAWLIAFIGVVYLVVAVDLLVKGNIGLGIAFIGYSLGNVGLYLAAKATA